MSKRSNKGLPYENHKRAAELHDGTAHAHDVAEQHGKQDHLTGHEQSRQASEHAQDVLQHSQVQMGAHGIATFGHDDIASLAYALWQARGCPAGSPEEDWTNAAEELRSRSRTR